MSPSTRPPIFLHLSPHNHGGGGTFARGFVTGMRAAGFEAYCEDAVGADWSFVHVEQVGNECHAPQYPSPCVGIVCFEDLACLHDSRALTNLRKYDRLLTLSTWNAALLEYAGFRDVPVVMQGVETTVFFPVPHPAQATPSFRIFSGGKLEPRKGQDLVLKKFRQRLETFPSAHLVCAWYSPHPNLARGFTDYGHVRTDPVALDSALRPRLKDLSSWLASEGIPEDRATILPELTDRQMADAIRSCDVAWFPNRAEGATNFLLAECLACGIPVEANWSTGQADLHSSAETGTCPPSWVEQAPKFAKAIYG